MIPARRFVTLTLALLLAVAVSGENAGFDYSSSAVQPDRPRRELTWDFFGFLMMMVGGQCGPGMHVRLGDHPKCESCMKGNGVSCEQLCAMASDHHKSHYKDMFCEDGSGGATYSSESAVNEASDSSFSGSATPGGINQDGAYAKGFQWWMLATAGAVCMALAAIHMGQKRDARNLGERSAMAGAVGRRFTAVNAFAEGMFPSKKAAAVELAPAAATVGGAAVASGDYQLDNDDATALVDEENASTASPVSTDSNGNEYAMC
ncbi:MAG: hypothetical protein SGARI_002861 [Bacillariaceae sp.]